MENSDRQKEGSGVQYFGAVRQFYDFQCLFYRCIPGELHLMKHNRHILTPTNCDVRVIDLLPSVTNCCMYDAPYGYSGCDLIQAYIPCLRLVKIRRLCIEALDESIKSNKGTRYLRLRPEKRKEQIQRPKGEEASYKFLSMRPLMTTILNKGTYAERISREYLAEVSLPMRVPQYG